MAEGGEKKHDATEHRRQKAREEGQMARSQDLGSAVVLLGAIGMLMTWGPDVFEFLAGFMRRSLSVAEFHDSSADRAVGWVAMTFWQSIMTLLPIFAAAMAVAWVSNWVQVGFLFLPSKISLNWSHIKSDLWSAAHVLDSQCHARGLWSRQDHSGRIGSQHRLVGTLGNDHEFRRAGHDRCRRVGLEHDDRHVLSHRDRIVSVGRARLRLPALAA